MKTLGTIDNFKGAWVIDAEPHIAIRLKRLFPRVARRGDLICLADTLETARELEWFTMRFPLAFKSPAVEGRMADRARQHRDTEETVEKIITGIQKPQAFRLALPAREYQKVAGTLFVTTPGILLGDDLGIGKQHPVDTKILTPTGYRQIGTLRTGDLVVGSDGKPTRVKGIFPQGIKPSYRVSFGDGSSVEAGPDHLWTMRYMMGGRRLAEIVVTTDQIRTGATITRTHGNGVTNTLSIGRQTLFLPMLTGAAQFEPLGELPIPAYAMGQLIANGCTCTTTVVITSHTDDAPFVHARLRAEGLHLGTQRLYGKACRMPLHGLLPALRSLSLTVKSRDKFIPPVYLRASIDDRVKLLHGMMDGDGSVSLENSRVTYSTSSRRLAEDMRGLVECLGGVAVISENDRENGKPIEYTVRVRTPTWVEPFSLPRKAAKYLPRQRRVPTRSLNQIEYVRNVESVCISVDAEDQLYATEHAILTHNSLSAICALTDPRTRPALVVTLTHLPKQWQREINRFAPSLTTHIIRGTREYDIARECGGKYPDVTITSYSKLAGWANYLAGERARFVVWDEGQEIRRGDKTQKGEAAYLIARKAQFRATLTATPIFNMGGELHSVMEITRPSALGTRTEFLREWCVGDSDNPGKVKLKDPKAMGTYLRDAGLMLRRTRKDVGRELPELTRVPHEIDCDLSVLKKIEGRATELARFILSANAKSRGESFKAAEMELSAIVRQATGVAKMPYTAEFIRMLVENGEPVIVGLWHRECYEILMEQLSNEKLGNLHPVMYSGSESPNQKEKAKQAFCSGESQVLLISLRSGVGLDGLQFHCRTGVAAELDWSPEVMKQLEGRIHRDGQPDRVLWYYPTATEGSDPPMLELLGVKQQQADGIKDPKGAFIHGLDVDGVNVRRLAESYLKRHAR